MGSSVADFADVVNWWLADQHVASGWRLQELPETLIALSEDGPDFGRNYAAFYNQQKIGKVQIYGTVGYGNETDKVHTYVELNWPRLLTFYDVAGFLGTIAMHVTDYKTDSQEHISAQEAIRDAMLKQLWDTDRISEFTDAGDAWGELSLSFTGTSSFYLLRKNAPAFTKLKRAAG